MKNFIRVIAIFGLVSAIIVTISLYDLSGRTARELKDSFSEKGVPFSPDHLPPGFKLETDGHQYRFVFPSGTASLFPGTKKEATAAAWRQYRDKMKKEEWTTVP